MSDHVSWLGDLALLTAVPGIPLAPTVAGAVPCPVVIRYRRGDRYLPEEEVPGTLDEVLRSRDLVIEVRLLSVPVGWRDPAPAGADRVR